MDKSLLEMKDLGPKRPIQFIGSKLVHNKDDHVFVNKLFDHRRAEGVKLLYRASENDFSVKRFHQNCDNETDTIVFVQTEFNKIIGGFTPVPWRSTANTLHSDIKQ